MYKLRTSLALLLVAFLAVPATATLYEVNVSGSFSPSMRTIQPGDQIRWVWVSGTHTTTHVPSAGNPVLWDEDITSSNQTYTRTFNTAGVFNYKCTPHGFTGRITVESISGILDDEDEAGGALSISALQQNSPNPFNASTQIEYSLDRDGQVTLAVYNILGQLVATLADGFQASGAHVALWDGRDDRGRELPSGIYFARMVMPGSAMTRKMVLLR